MSKKDRKQFFGLRYEKLDRPVYMDELGSQIQIAGLILQGNDQEICVYLPAHEPYETNLLVRDTTVPEWTAILQSLDEPEMFELDETGGVKAVHRKNQRLIGSALQWQVYRRDGYKCMFCKQPGGTKGRSLSVDHFIPVEAGGGDEPANLISSCRSCNRQKGNQHPAEWLGEEKYVELIMYLKTVPV